MTVNMTTIENYRPEPFTTDDEKVQFELLEKLVTSLRPILLEEGGDAQPVSVRDGVARVAFGGGCEGCGGALENMEGGLRLMILERVPGLKEVIFE